MKWRLTILPRQFPSRNPLPMSSLIFSGCEFSSRSEASETTRTNDMTRLISRWLILRGSLNTVHKPVSYLVPKPCYVIVLRKLHLNLNYFLKMCAILQSVCVLKFCFARFTKDDVKYYNTSLTKFPVAFLVTCIIFTFTFHKICIVSAHMYSKPSS
jgi:hypothetical protein